MPTDSIWVGIDAGKHHHHAAAIDSDGTLLWSIKIANDEAAISALIDRAVGCAAVVWWAVDLTSAAAALLLALLARADQRVTYVAGLVVNRMSGAFAGEGKTDARDARVIAETARLRRDLSQITTPDPLTVELSRAGCLPHRPGQRVGPRHQPTPGLLTSIFPGLERACDYSHRTPLMLVAAY